MPSTSDYSLVVFIKDYSACNLYDLKNITCYSRSIFSIHVQYTKHTGDKIQFFMTDQSVPLGRLAKDSYLIKAMEETEV